MNSKRRIALLLTLVFLLPALFFSVYEWSSLNQNERMIQDIYKKQLEAILFSVNQYSDDILTNWIARVEGGIYGDTMASETPARIIDLLSLNPSLQAVYLVKPGQADKPDRVFVLNDHAAEQEIWPRVSRSLTTSRPVIDELIGYKKSGFQKIQELPLDSPGFHFLVFITGQENDAFHVAGFVIDTELFVEDVIGPRLQTVAQEQFNLSVIRGTDGQTIYSTETRQDASGDAEAVTKEFWIFPNYALGIRAIGTTLQDLVNARTRTNLFLLVGLDLILIVAVVLVFRNLKREVDLAQNKSEFVSNVSHEIRTPLAVISMFAETLEMDRVPTEEKKREYYHIISQEAQRLSGIVNRILNFSQAESKKRILHPEIVSPGEVINGVLNTYDFHLRNKGFDYTYAEVGKVSIRADREAMAEVLINLIDNAIKYSDETKRIEIKTTTEGLWVVILVRDYGIGIAEKEQRKIFDKFYRVSSGDLAKSRGTGLGLSLVRELMEAQRGKVTVESTPGSGSIFKLYFQRV